MVSLTPPLKINLSEYRRTRDNVDRAGDDSLACVSFSGGLPVDDEASDAGSDVCPTPPE